MAWATPPVTPVSSACVVQAALWEHVPLAALVGILGVESGRIGHVHLNPDGSYDIGPAQINNRAWLARIEAHGVSEITLLNNGCANVLAGAWVLSWALAETHGNIWSAIGRYHSADPKLALNYERHVYRVMLSGITLTQVLRLANQT